MLKTINEQIAEKLGWQIYEDENGWGYKLVRPDLSLTNGYYDYAESAWKLATPRYDTDRNAAAEIVEWFATCGDENQRAFFEDAIFWAGANKHSSPVALQLACNSYPLTMGALATPAQIVAAACKVWGIEEGGEDE